MHVTVSVLGVGEGSQLCRAPHRQEGGVSSPTHAKVFNIPHTLVRRLLGAFRSYPSLASLGIPHASELATSAADYVVEL